MWRISEDRNTAGALVKMTLSEGVESPSKMGPVEVVRCLHIERFGKTWTMSVTGPRGGRCDEAVFSDAALRALLIRLQAEL